MTWRVLVSAPYMLPVLDDFRPRLERAGIDVVTVPVRERLTEAELLPVVSELDGAICGDDAFTARVLAEAKRLRVIAKWGTGIDSIDLDAARRLGIRICNTPGAFTDPVADSVLGYVLCFARRLPWMDRDVRAGGWRKLESRALRECTLGVVGVGNIGRAVVHRAVAFGMTVLGNDPVQPPAPILAGSGLTMVSLDELLERSDFVSLNCDLNPTSFHLIGAAELARMKRSAFLINTARGRLVDEPALLTALRERRIAGAALDVYEHEPLPADSALRSMDNCLLAPHNANSSPAAWARVHERTIESLLAGLREAR